MKRFIVGGVAALSIAAAACGATSGISDENRRLANIAWQQVTPATQAQFCQGMDTLDTDAAADAFNEGANYIFTHEEAVQIISYLDAEYC